MKSINGKLYIDGHGKKYIKIRNVGYELYAYLRDDGSYGYVGGCVGPEYGWKQIDNPPHEDKQLIKQIEKAKLYGVDKCKLLV